MADVFFSFEFLAIVYTLFLTLLKHHHCWGGKYFPSGCSVDNSPLKATFPLLLKSFNLTFPFLFHFSNHFFSTEENTMSPKILNRKKKSNTMMMTKCNLVRNKIPWCWDNNFTMKAKFHNAVWKIYNQEAIHINFWRKVFSHIQAESLLSTSETDIQHLFRGNIKIITTH